MQETLVQFLGQEDPLEKGQATHSSVLGFPGGSDGKECTCNARDLGLIPGLEGSPGEGKGTHSNILAWRIPWTVLSMRTRRVGHDERLSLSLSDGLQKSS